MMVYYLICRMCKNIIKIPESDFSDYKSIVCELGRKLEGTNFFYYETYTYIAKLLNLCCSEPDYIWRDWLSTESPLLIYCNENKIHGIDIKSIIELKDNKLKLLLELL